MIKLNRNGEFREIKRTRQITGDGQVRGVIKLRQQRDELAGRCRIERENLRTLTILVTGDVGYR